MKVELWKIERVKPYDKNPRRNDAAVDRVAASLKEFGFRNQTGGGGSIPTPSLTGGGA